MKKLFRNSDGFSPVEIVVVLVIIIAIVIAGVVVANHKSKTTKATAAAKTSVETGTYATWKESCDTATKFCFKYPSNWKIVSQKVPSIGIANTVTNPDTSANAQYGNFLISAGDPPSVTTTNPLSTSAAPSNVAIDLSNGYNFYVISVNATADKNDAYKVISGYYESATENIPAILLMDSATATSAHVTAGQDVALKTNSFNVSSLREPNNYVLFGSGPITLIPFSPTQASDWLNSSTGKISLQIVESFRAQ